MELNELFGMTNSTYEKKKDAMPIVKLVENLLSQADLEEFSETGTIKKLEFIKDFDYDELKEPLKEHYNKKLQNKIDELKSKRID